MRINGKKLLHNAYAHTRKGGGEKGQGAYCRDEV